MIAGTILTTLTTLATLRRHALGAGIGALLLACAAPAGTPLQHPATAALAADAQADDYYALGRSRFAAGQAADALAAYRRALALDPDHVNAQNGVAVLYAGQGDYAGAIAIWSALTRPGAAAPTPARTASAYLFGNLGYAYLLAGDTERAVAALSQACLLDPVDTRAWAHLGEALRRAGEKERAAQALQQAEALRQHDVRADYALLGRQNRAPAPLPRLEISNGNGVRGMAASLGRTLRDGGQAWGALRLSNGDNFRLATSRIEYRPEQEAAARRLAQQLGTPARMRVCRCERADVRLVLGRDLLDPAALRRHYLWQLAQARQALAALRGS